MLAGSIVMAVVALATTVAVFTAPVALPPAVLAAPLLLTPLVWRRPVLRLLLVAAAVAALGAWHVGTRLADRLDPALEAATLELSGRVVSLPEPIPWGRRFEFEPDAPRAGVPRRLRVAWYGRGAAPAAAERWRLTLRLRRPRGPLNPGSLDHEAWAFSHGIGAQASARVGTRLTEAAPGLLRARATVVAAIQDACAPRPACAVVQGLAVGHVGALAPATWQMYRDTGTLHLIAISGLHVTLLALLAHLVVRALWARIPPLATRWPAALAAAPVALAVATGYALLAGFGVPARRTLAMLLVACVALLWRRATTPTRVLATALLLVLLADPVAVLAPGFWLSFAGVAVLMWAGGETAWRFTGFARAQWAATLGLAPVLALAFGSLPLAGLIGNALAIPVFNLIAVPAAVGGAVLLPIAPDAAALAFRAAAVVLDSLTPVLAALADGLPQVGVPSPGPFSLGLAVLGAGLALAPRGVPGRVLAPILCLPLLVPDLPRPAPGAYELTVLDVGQGHAAVVRTRDHTLIYDAGPAWPGGDAGATAVLPYLRAIGLRPDLLVVSHADSDHAGGVRTLRRRWPGLAVLAGEDHVRLGPVARCQAGQTWDWDGVRFTVLHPRGTAAHGNAASCVLRVAGPGGASLLTGDLPAREEGALRAALELDPLAVLVSPHHGSAGSSSPAFVAAVAPSLVIHAAGHANRWGFPRPEVLARYAALGAEQRVTGRDGAVLVSVPADGRLQVQIARRLRERPWRAH
jgi:competence protein ComEC